MTELALVLVLLSAISHAAWNYIAKTAAGTTPEAFQSDLPRSWRRPSLQVRPNTTADATPQVGRTSGKASTGPVFNWLFDSLSVVVCLPLGIAQVLIQPHQLGPIEWTFILGSGLLHLAYFLLLGQGYRVGELSLVYPLARGLGPMLSTAAAVLLLGERPSALALTGVALVGIGVFVLAGNPRRVHAASVIFAVLTGVVIAGYTLWDKQAVSDTGLAIPPVLYFYLFTVCRAAMLTPFALSRLPTVKSEWRLHWRHALGIAVLSPLSYVLVLYALSFSPVSYVAPVREIGILIGAVLGTRWLAEGHGRTRLAGAVAMVAGVVALAAG